MSSSDHIMYPGLYRGYIVDNADWEKLDDKQRMLRVQVNVPAVYGDQVPKDKLPWAVPMLPFAGPSYGLYRIPIVGERVWIQFEAGDPQFPVWCGNWIKSGDIPSEMMSNLGGERSTDIYERTVVLKGHYGFGLKMSADGLELFYHPQTVSKGVGEDRPKTTQGSQEESMRFMLTVNPKFLTDSEVGAWVLRLNKWEAKISGESTFRTMVRKLQEMAAEIRIFGTNRHLPEYEEKEDAAGTMRVGAEDSYRVGSKKGGCPNGSWG